MPICPICHQPMAAEQLLSIAGIQNKEVGWYCRQDEIRAGAVHPVQISHLHVGDEENHEDGGRTRILKLEMQGGELMVFRQVLALPTTPHRDC
jgi:hypothetical protein